MDNRPPVHLLTYFVRWPPPRWPRHSQRRHHCTTLKRRSQRVCLAHQASSRKKKVQSGWRLGGNSPALQRSRLDSVTSRHRLCRSIQELSRGIKCTVTPPEKHEKSVGRRWQTLLTKMNVLTDTLPYKLPPSLHFALLKFACNLLKSHPNSQFPFASPHIIVHGTHNGYAAFSNGIPLPFGTTVRSLEAPGIEPQTGLVVGNTANFVGSHQVYYSSYNKQHVYTYSYNTFIFHIH